jgi:hypothetical protein
MDIPLFIFITRSLNEDILKKLRSLVRAGVDAYIMCDENPEIRSKRVLHIPDSHMEEIGWTHHMSQKENRITAWDKATYYGYSTQRNFVWICEDDVYWNTPSIIKQFVDTSSKADLITYPIHETYQDNPNWYHWNKVELLTRQKKYWASSYNQFCRLSRRLLERMAELSRERKRLYFHEGMFITLCNIYGYPIEYLKQDSLFISIRWNKSFTAEQVKQLIKEHKHVLLHPVKISV